MKKKKRNPAKQETMGNHDVLLINDNHLCVYFEIEIEN